MVGRAERAPGPRPAWAQITAEPSERRVDPDGLLDAAPRLLAYLRAALACELGSVTCWWLGEGPPLRLDLTRRAAGEHGGAAVELVATPEPPPFGLTRRELQVLTLLAGGLSNAEVGTRLGTGARTVASQVERVLAKLDQSTRAGAAAVAAEHGALCLPVPGGGHSLAGLAVGRLQLAVEHGVGATAARPASPTGPPRPPRRRPVVLGSLFPVGEEGGDGDEMRKGAALAVAEVNRRGGIGGRPLEHVVIELADASASEAKRGLDELVALQVDAITLGYVTDRDGLLPVIERAASAGCPVLHSCTAQAAADAVREEPERLGSVFQVGPPETLYTDGFLRFVEQLRAAGAWRPPNRRLALLEPSLRMPLVRADTLERAERAGWQVEPIAHADDPEAVVRRLRALEPAAALVPSLVDDGPLLLALLDALHVDPFDCLLYAVYTPSIPGFLRRAGERAEGLVWSTVIGRGGDRLSTRFGAEFAAAFGRPPGMSQAGLQYDSVQLLAGAWRAVDSPRRFAAVAAELRRRVHRGVSGSYWLEEPGQSGLGYPDMTPDPSIAHPHRVLQVVGGGHRTLAPAPFADGRFTTQPWMRAARQPSRAAG
ncbi:ABC transporter substrate-binding protein [Conexibacter arvalis]|uniref:Branched-chain amino acid transport system substrate-binding protein n=1 Tax=Conexibacter arvalis TaxID=912552 RepID=A0A840IMS6_9ACTN|nr:ABC transporter substrate-binding protein [Conexibacter arvalis]MBB4665160.1 branched-chain amino acid transport system substrate-binding protein [Conexibacter arvalis]